MKKFHPSVFLNVLMILTPVDVFAGAESEIIRKNISDEFWNQSLSPLYFVSLLVLFGAGMYALSKNRFWNKNSKKSEKST